MMFLACILPLCDHSQTDLAPGSFRSLAEFATANVFFLHHHQAHNVFTGQAAQFIKELSLCNLFYDLW